MDRLSSRHQRIVLLGGGIVGQLAALLLARDGHRVTLLERDPEPPPADAEACWSVWQRRGVPQFRLPHVFQPRIRETIERELPDVADALERAGCLRFNVLRALPDGVTGGFVPGDERFDLVTARRPVVEGALAREAAHTQGLTLRRGVAAVGLVVDHDGAVPRVTGVRTTRGETLPADLVVDAAGRRSPLADLLVDAAVRRPVEQVDDVGYVYFSRDFRSADGRLPTVRGPVLQVHDSISIGTFPADAGCWSVVVMASARDRALRSARRVDVWQRIVEHYPMAREWTCADEASDVTVIAGMEDRWRDLVVDGRPVVTGVVSIGDAWACTSPSVGRGVAIGALHAVALRDHLRERGCDRVGDALAWRERTEATVVGWWRDTHSIDVHRLRQIDAQVAGEVYAPDDPAWRMSQALSGAAGQDPMLLRQVLEIASVMTRGVDVLARPGVAARALELAPGARPLPGLTRAELMELVSPVAA